MEAGDRYGFTWLTYGVVGFDQASNNNYCKNSVKSNVGETVSLTDNRFGNREYSIRVTFCEESELDCGRSFLIFFQLQESYGRSYFLGLHFYFFASCTSNQARIAVGGCCIVYNARTSKVQCLHLMFIKHQDCCLNSSCWPELSG